LLSAQNICWHQDGKDILKDIDFHLEKGEIVGLVGPNGSGKSSLLKILSFLEKPTSGKLIFQGKETAGNVPLVIRRRIAVVFQEPLLLNTTVFENVACGLKIRGLKKCEIKHQVENWLNSFGVLHLINQPARSLSGGEAQRVSLARAFVLEPDILFLDEPFSALDTPTKEALINDMEEILGTTKTTAVLVSHDFRDILRLTQRAVVLVNGRVEDQNDPIALLYGSSSVHVENFLAHWKKEWEKGVVSGGS
jgi:tungstate transport system ATP-binding protein